MKIRKLSNGWEFWYDHHVRVWYAMQTDAAGHEIDGTLLDSGTKDGILHQLSSCDGVTADDLRRAR